MSEPPQTSSAGRVEMLRAPVQKSVAVQSYRRGLVQPCIMLTTHIKYSYNLRIWQSYTYSRNNLPRVRSKRPTALFTWAHF